MTDEKKPVDGEVVGETVTGRLIRRNEVYGGEKPNRFMTHAEKKAYERTMARANLSQIEETLFSSYAGGFIGMCYDPEKEKKKLVAKEDRLIILTDEDDDL